MTVTVLGLEGEYRVGDVDAGIPLTIAENSDELSPIAQLQKQLPYRNYPTSQSISHPQPNTQAKSAWTGQRGYGQKHVLDTAHFSLWDTENHDFRHPTSMEMQWITSHFKASAIRFQFPILVIEISHLPSPLPLTVALVAVASNTTANFKARLEPIPIDHHHKLLASQTHLALHSLSRHNQ